MKANNYSTELKKIAPSIDWDDKIAARDANIASLPTIEKYLAGNVVKVNIAVELISFFKRRIDSKIKSLQKSVA